MLKSHLNIFRSLTWKYFKGKYAGYSLGVWWIIFVPIVTAVIINFVFLKVMKIEFPNFGLFALSGLLPWGFFSRGICDSICVLPEMRVVINQFNVPKYLFVVSVVFYNFVIFLMGLSAITVFCVFTYQKIWIGLLLLPVVLAAFLVFVVSLAMIFFIVGVFFKDIQELATMLFMFLFWLTPVFYSINMIPQKYIWIIKLNPLTLFIDSFQQIIFYTNTVPVKSISGMFFLAFVFMLFSMFLYSKLEKHIAKNL